jgi:hypothetical protein
MSRLSGGFFFEPRDCGRTGVVKNDELMTIL